MELLDCHNLAVPKEVMHHLVRVESSYNPFAIGVVGGRLDRQPQSLPEALATVRMLEARGFNFSLGLAQVNRHNLRKYGLGSYEAAFEACPNLQVGSRILAECYGRFSDWGKSFSCYYSGNPVTGFRHGYVQKVFASMRAGDRSGSLAPKLAIRADAGPSRRVIGATRYPIGAVQADSQRMEPPAAPLQGALRLSRAAIAPQQHSLAAANTSLASPNTADSVRQELVVDRAFVF